MNALRVLPFLFVPFSIQVADVKAQAPQVPITSPVPKENFAQNKNKPEGLGPIEALLGLQQKIPLLTHAERNAAKEVKEFIGKYTDGKLHYGSRNVTDGLANDYAEIMQQARSRGVIPGILTRRHLKGRTLIPRIGNKIENEIQDAVYRAVLPIFQGLGVNPNTANKPDSRREKLPNVKEVRRLGENLKILEERRKKVFEVIAPGIPITLNFPGGLTAEAMDYVLNGTLGVPPGAELIFLENKKGNGR